MTVLALMLITSVLIVKSCAFKATLSQGDDPAMYTHESITLNGVDRAAAKFLTSTGQFNTTKTDHDDIVREYFGTDTKGYHEYQNQAHQFATAVMNVYKVQKNNPDYTVNSERIRDADAVVKSTRLEIAAILSEGRLSDASVGQLIDKVGTCLMVLQSFYSNTNWVEMMVNGGESFLNFGTLTPFNMSVAESGTDTCRNCDDRFANGCKYNLLIHDRLTSGYLYGQLYYPKPVANPRATEGKCSHGGPDDTGKNNTATGGINKETPDWTRSPHAHLHNMAGLTAVRATESFFIDKVTGLLKDVSRDVVQEIFKLNRTERQVPYLGLALDISTSMVTDISSLKNGIVGILSAVMGTDNAPGKYVLSTFAGQANLTNVVTTTDPNEFIRLLNDLTLVPKTSCPTYVMSGIRAAIKACTPHSTVYVATDVDAKDNNLMSTVMEEATEKHISLKFLLTGSCS